ncbi:iron uptake system protein EfeO [Cryptosporangium aurantiacum]|uniref:Iron uptake system component EfeO n=1 Tax=Cryptosporangium aurantiacum TaxID=134849 RepID=A0A1M7QUH3_9ACTN|nr:iron uptake system protein EfeO [Cryptosporangium aurantiacum]SHN35355.1 iron uptake system component EfeO [Cryptosporangium aurantiacum]
MRTSRPSTVLVLALAGVTLLGAAGCGSSDDDAGDAGGGPVAVAATDTTCKLDRTDLDAGTNTFEIKNTGSKVTEFYVYAEGDRIMGEVENIGPGLSRKLIVELPAGSYEGACKPGMKGDGIRTALKVTGAAESLSTDDQLAAAAQSYQRYVKSQTGALITKTTEFVNAVKANDIEKAKTLFPIARTYWERIEPVAESFGDLDPKIDARENDVEPGTEWTGYHRIEKDLWITKDVSKDGALADQLLKDVQEVVDKANTVQLSPLQLANGAKELMDEVATGKITGEEDRYSHTDLWDFQANVEGSKAAIAALRPTLDDRNPELAKKLDAQFEAVQKLLDAQATDDGFKLYTELTQAEIRQFAAAVDALSEPLSQVAAVVAQK